MPYHWTQDDQTETLRLWPHQSLTRSGFAAFFGTTAVLLLLPLIPVLGSPVLWVLLAFFVAAFVAIWMAVQRNRTDREIEERLTITRDRVHLEHRAGRTAPLSWQANPQWVRVNLRSDGPVENYLTLSGGGREVELGAFLTPEERADLKDDLHRHLSRI